MKNRSPFSALRVISLSFLAIAIVLSVLQLVRFSRVRAYFPSDLKIAGIPVGGLDRQQAAQRLLEVYSTPVILWYGEDPVALHPSVVDFQLDLDRMLAAADLERTETIFWSEFWEFLWGRHTAPPDIPLRYTFSEQRLRIYLSEVAERYDQPPVAAMPVAGTVNFRPGAPGTTLDVDGSVLLIENALRSLTRREVTLPLQRSAPTRPPFQNLEVLLKQTIDVAGFDGLAGVYLVDLQTGQEIHFATQMGEDLPVQPDIAFTASSIIKLPVMVSAFRSMDGDSDAESYRLMSEMITESGNEVSDWLMDRELHDTRGPLVVTEDMQTLGLENTFLAGYFTLGSPLLQAFSTPANQRVDVFTDPDPYSQTTPSDIGMLLDDIYQCAEKGGGTLLAAFGGEVDQVECQMMIDLLVKNKLPFLLTAGIPEGTQIAHKHGWVSTNGIINTIGDAGIIYTPGGDFVLVTFLYHPQQLLWDPAAALIANLGRAAYNYYNLPSDVGG